MRLFSRLKITETAKRFLSYEIPESVEKFFGMMADANYLFDNGYMSLQALADRIISRSSSEIRIVLWNSAGIAKSMFDFSKLVERVIPLAYGKEGSMNVIKVGVNQINSCKDMSNNKIKWWV